MSATEDAVSALADGIARLAEEDRGASAEGMALVLLGIDTREARDAFVDDPSALAEIGGEELGEAVLRVARANRAASDWPRWLDRLSAESAAKIPSAADQVDGLGADLWAAANAAEDPVEGDALDATLASVERIAGAAETAGTATAAAVVTTTAAPPLDQAAAGRQAQSLRLAARFASAGLLRIDQFAPSALDSIAEVLAQLFEACPPEDPLARHVVEWATWLAPWAGDESRDRLHAAAEASPWLPAPYRATLTLAAAVRDQADPAVSPYSAGEIVELLAAHGAWFAEGLALWIERFNPSPGEVGSAIQPLVGDELPEKVLAAIDSRVAEADAGERAELLMPTLDGLLDSPTSSVVLRRLGIERADPEAILSRLISLYGEAGVNGDRERVLEVVAMLGTLEDSLRRRLILEVIIPLAQRGKEALDIAVRHLNLCLPPPHGTKQKLRDTLRGRAKGKQQTDRVDKALLDAGLVKRTGLFGRGRKDTPDG